MGWHKNIELPLYAGHATPGRSFPEALPRVVVQTRLAGMKVLWVFLEIRLSPTPPFTFIYFTRILPSCQDIVLV